MRTCACVRSSLSRLRPNKLRLVNVCGTQPLVLPPLTALTTLSSLILFLAHPGGPDERRRTDTHSERHYTAGCSPFLFFRGTRKRMKSFFPTYDEAFEFKFFPVRQQSPTLTHSQRSNRSFRPIAPSLTIRTQCHPASF